MTIPEQARWRRFQPRSVPAVRASLIVAELAECGTLTLAEMDAVLWPDVPGVRPWSGRQLLRNLLAQLEYDGVVERLTRVPVPEEQRQPGEPRRVTKWVLRADRPVWCRAGGNRWPTPGRWAEAVADDARTFR